jgi:hypothetical protein
MKISSCNQPRAFDLNYFQTVFFVACSFGILLICALHLLAAVVFAQGTPPSNPTGLKFGPPDPEVSSCEAVAPRKCYYLDPAGSDSNPGTLAAPWKSFKNIASYYTGSFQPAGWVNLQGGDYVYLKSGVYTQTVTPGDGSGANGGGKFIAYFRGKNGSSNARITVKAYPGHTPILDPAKTGLGIYLLQSSWWKFEGFHIRNAYPDGFSIAEADQILVDKIQVYDTDGVDNNNMSGMNLLSSTNIEISNSVFHDNYDRTNADTGGEATENSSNMVLFGGGNVTVRDSVFYQTPSITSSKSGACLKYKHGFDDPNLYFRVYNNQFRNCKFYSIGTGAPNSHIHHNVIITGDGINTRDFGGRTYQSNQLFEYNTFYNNNSIFNFDPSTEWQNANFPSLPKNIAFKNNIAIDMRNSSLTDDAIITVGNYMSDATYQKTISQITFSDNCYYKPNASLTFSIGAVNGGSYGSLGALYSFANWKAQGFDTAAVNAQPVFVNAAGGDYRLTQASPCQGKGAHP